MKNQGRYLKIFALIIITVGLISCRDQDTLDTSKFDVVDNATSIIVEAHLTTLPPIVIDDPDKVNFSKEFVHKYAESDNWEGPPPAFLSERLPGFTFSINFFENDEFLFFWGLDRPDTLVYLPYKKSIPEEEFLLLINTLDIPEEYTFRPK